MIRDKERKGRTNKKNKHYLDKKETLAMVLYNSSREGSIERAFETAAQGQK